MTRACLVVQMAARGAVLEVCAQREGEGHIHRRLSVWAGHVHEHQAALSARALRPWQLLRRTRVSWISCVTLRPYMHQIDCQQAGTL